MKLTNDCHLSVIHPDKATDEVPTLHNAQQCFIEPESETKGTPSIDFQFQSEFDFQFQW
jgi:hypothetical protein